ncbi:hypothetical protein XELAEV_18027753mg [Xenopus laevis]|uniref:Uncharacterized protein n=1 Tax=Xenopus laevis TaxID=8355 RepID=A0A974HKJ4_XENLA|nr:hypothetical protein XELAEV_18027753mg [Xenopus laevis]
MLYPPPLCPGENDSGRVTCSDCVLYSPIVFCFPSSELLSECGPVRGQVHGAPLLPIYPAAARKAPGTIITHWPHLLSIRYFSVSFINASMRKLSKALYKLFYITPILTNV